MSFQETPQGSSEHNIINMDDVAKSFQREAEALREIVRNRDQQIRALKAHSLCLRSNFKSILEAVVDRVIDQDIQHHAKRMITELETADSVIEKVGSGQ